MTRPSKRALAREIEELRDGDGTTFGEVVFTDSDGEIWGRSTGNGIEEATAADLPDGVDVDDLQTVADFSGGDGR
jgi:hypothetical protein